MATDEPLPPGTQNLEDIQKSKLILCPRPSSDPNQPLRWSTWRKTLQICILSFYGIMMFAVITAQPAMWSSLNLELGLTYDQLNNGYATAQGTQAVACIFFVPLALKYGRRPAYILTSLIMLACTIWSARMQTYGDLIGTNVLCGIASVVNEALFQMTICDMFYVHQRGTLTGVFLIMVLVGNYFGPVAVGYATVSQGWRWVYWYCTIFMAIVSLLVIFALEETKWEFPADMIDVGINEPMPAPDKLAESSEMKTDSIVEKQPHSDERTKSTTATVYSSSSAEALAVGSSIPLKSYRQLHALYTTYPSKQPSTGRDILRLFYGPFVLLFTFPAVFFAAFTYGWCITMVAALAVIQADLYVLPPYNFSAAGIGLMNIPPAIGGILGALFGGALIDLLIIWVSKRRGGIYEPETRLWLFIVPGMCMVIGNALFGLTIAKHEAWIINAVGGAFIGFALSGCGDMALSYLQDCYQEILGPSLVAVVFVRNAIATGFIFALPPWRDGMGTYNMFVVMIALAVFFALLYIPLVIWGRKWRVLLADKYYFHVKQLSWST